MNEFMDSIATALNSNSVISLFLVIGLGLALGNVKLAGFSLGSSAVMFVALAFGQLGLTIPPAIKNLGVILFVYAVGLQVGPRFFHTIRRNGITYLCIALLSLLSGMASIVIIGKAIGIPADLGIGAFAGALTSTPGLAAALDVLDENTSVSVGFGIAYLFGVIGVVLFVQTIANKQCTKDEVEAERNAPVEASSNLKLKAFIVTNPNCTGKPLIEIDLHSMTRANITRIVRNSQEFMAYDTTAFQLNDIVHAVGTERELRKLEHIIGKETTPIELDKNKEIAVRDVFVSSPRITGKRLKDLEVLELFGVRLTRLRRDEIDIVPTGDTTMEIGDLIRVAGTTDDCERFVQIAGQQERRIHETNLLAMCAGITLGGYVGAYTFNLPGGMTFNLGLAGGPMLVAILISHAGRIGPISTRVPYAAKYLCREIGLVFFLAAAGAEAGDSFVEMFQSYGVQIFLLGAAATTVSMFSAYLLGRYLFRLSRLASLGVVCGSMTSTPALGIAASSVDSDTPAIAYASTYPLALVLVTLISQILASVL